MFWSGITFWTWAWSFQLITVLYMDVPHPIEDDFKHALLWTKADALIPFFLLRFWFGCFLQVTIRESFLVRIKELNCLLYNCLYGMTFSNSVRLKSCALLRVKPGPRRYLIEMLSLILRHPSRGRRPVLMNHSFCSTGFLSWMAFSRSLSSCSTVWYCLRAKGGREGLCISTWVILH